jgi:hypothetical protein
MKFPHIVAIEMYLKGSYCTVNNHNHQGNQLKQLGEIIVVYRENYINFASKRQISYFRKTILYMVTD